MKFLGIFYEATLRFSEFLFVTSNTYFQEIISIEDQLQQLCSIVGGSTFEEYGNRGKKNI